VRRIRKPGKAGAYGNVEVRICRLTRKNKWGYKRIQSYLKKLNITLSKTFISKILGKNRLPPAPKNTKSTSFLPYSYT